MALNNTILGTELKFSWFSITLGTLIEAVLILFVSVFIGRVLRKVVIRASKTTRLPWIINQDTGDIIFRMFVLGGIIGSLYKIGLMAYRIAGTTVGNIAFAVGFFYFMYLIAKKSKDYLLMGAGRKPSSELQVQAKVFYYTILTVSFFLALNLAGIGTYLGAILAAAGITGIVLGFSAQTVVSNFISGLFMYFDKPLNIGDPVRIDNLEGIVEDMRILSTRIRSWDGTLIRIPNEKLFNSNIINLQRYPARRLDVKIGIAYDSDMERAIGVIRKTLDNMPLVLAEPEPLVFVEDLGDSAIIISIKAWAPSEKWFSVKTELLHKVKKALDEAGIEIPFPQRVNWFANELRVKVEGSKKNED